MKQLRKAIGQITALIMCIVLLTGNALADEDGPFPDVPANASYAEAIAVLAELGILQGDELGNFNPDNTITRAEAVTVICRMLGGEESIKEFTDSGFWDVPDSHWAAGYISKMTKLGIVSGYGDGRFAPDDPVTQEQMIKMLVCVMDHETEALELGGWFSGYLSMACSLGIVSQNENVTSDAATRSCVAVYIYNCINSWE